MNHDENEPEFIPGMYQFLKSTWSNHPFIEDQQENNNAIHDDRP